MIPVRSGVLLVALPVLADPNFARTVVYLVDHGRDGTVGVILNRPGAVTVRDRLPGWARQASEPGTFHLGGPCETDTALALGVGAPLGGLRGLRPVDRSVHLVDLDADADVVGVALQGLRIFTGYAGWSPGQLAREIAADAWLVTSARPADVVGPDSAGLWRAVLRRQDAPWNLLSAWTAEPGLN